MNTQTKNSVIIDAQVFAWSKHKDQKDDAGLPYTTHLSQVVRILERVTTDEDILAAGWLHDTLEDTNTKYEDLYDTFGKRIADLVHEVTHNLYTQGDPAGKIFPRLKSRDAILIKFADRLSNLSRMEAWDEDRKQHYLDKSKFWKSNYNMQETMQHTKNHALDGIEYRGLPVKKSDFETTGIEYQLNSEK